MKTLYFVFIFILYSTFIFAQTTIPGGNVSGTWTAAGSPYLIEGEITVHTDSTLVIEPAVEVNFQGNYSLTVNGYLQAVGTEVDSIHFFPEDTVTGWGGITFDFDDWVGLTYPLSYCTFRYASTAVAARYFAAPVISHCDFSHNTNSAIFTQLYTVPQISYCTFHDNIGINGGALYLFEFGAGTPLEITGCIFENNTATEEGGAIFIGVNCTGVAQITDCIFGENVAQTATYYEGGGAICVTFMDIDITRCAFYLNQGCDGGAILVKNIGACSTTLNHCTFWGNVAVAAGVGDGLFLGDGSDAIIRNSIFAHHEEAIFLYSSTLTGVSYSDFYDNWSYDIQNQGGTIPANFGVINTINANGDSCDVYYNIFMDPLFVDTSNGDLHLTEDSPCIDAGDPVFAYDPDGTITDMGAYYFNQITVLDPPQNVTIEIIGTDVQLNWDAVTSANSYKIYSSDDPDTGFVEDTSGSFAGESWSTSILNEKKFYHVTAVR